MTRYYDPATGRFISADRYISTGTGLLGFNMYAYCSNNPVNNIDVYGQLNAEHAGVCGTHSEDQLTAYYLAQETELSIDEDNKQITATLQIENNKNAENLNNEKVALMYSEMVRDDIEEIAEASPIELTVMTQEHIYAEVLAHYYGYEIFNLSKISQSLASGIMKA